MYPTGELIEALRAYHEATGRRVILAWTMMAGVQYSGRRRPTAGRVDAGAAIKIDLIDVNDPTGRYRPPSREELGAFRDALSAKLGVPWAAATAAARTFTAALRNAGGRSKAS